MDVHRSAVARRLAAVPVELLSRDQVHTVDAIELPPARRRGVGPRASAATRIRSSSRARPRRRVERLLELIGDAQRRGDHRRDRRGALRRRSCSARSRRPACEPEVAAVPPGERHKTLAPGVRAARLAHRHADRPPRPDRESRRRRRDRHGRLGRQLVHARGAVREPADHADRPGRRGHRRQAGGEPPGGEEPDRRLPPAARGDLGRVVPRARSGSRQLRAGPRRVDQEGDHRLARLLAADRRARRRDPRGRPAARSRRSCTAPARSRPS